MDQQHIWRQQEMEDQLKDGLDWDEYEPERYGWETSGVLSLHKNHLIELANELGPTSIPHKTRCFRG